MHTGIITRQRAEFLLFPKPEGTFLIRVSDRVRGYVLSYRTKEKCRHYLIDVTIVQLVIIIAMITHQHK